MWTGEGLKSQIFVDVINGPLSGFLQFDIISMSCSVSCLNVAIYIQ
jgi:hypothetical protein